MSIKSFLESGDPLSQEALEELVKHREEDLYVDYKESFVPKDEQHWLSITKDAMAFANTMGGYIVFGVRDESFTPVGLPQSTIKVLVNTNMILQKLNRYVAPSFTGIRTKKKDAGGVSLVVMYIPESKGHTHIVVKIGQFMQKSGEPKIVLRPGMIFVRRSATNHIVNPQDLDFIINRRIRYFQDSLFDKVARVIKAPVEHQVLVFDPDSVSGEGRTFVISDSPDAVPVKGMSFTVSPSSDVEELAGWIALAGRDPAFQPRGEQLWRLYSTRSELKINLVQLKELVGFCLLAEVPVFYWLRHLEAGEIKNILLKALGNAPNIQIKANMLHTGAFLGKTFYGRLLKKLGDGITRLGPRSKKFPQSGPREFWYENTVAVKRKTSRLPDKKFREELEGKLTLVAKRLSEGHGDYMSQVEAKAMDCYLYARDDKYIRVQPKEDTEED